MVLIDNTVLSNFALIRQPEYIRTAFLENVAATVEVFHELELGMQLQRLPQCDWTWLTLISLTDAEKARCQELMFHLDKGEASCLAVAIQRKWKLATDDRDARQWAIRLSVPHTGTLGILAALVKGNHITLFQGNLWLKTMLDAGYRSPISTLDQLL